MTYPPVYVVWRDISVKTGWCEQDDIDSFVSDDTENIVYQCGFLYEEDENQICVLNSFFENKDLLGDLCKIPKGCVIKIVKLSSPSA